MPSPPPATPPRVGTVDPAVDAHLISPSPEPFAASGAGDRAAGTSTHGPSHDPDQQALFALVARGGADGLWLWDIARARVTLSPRFRELLGYVDGHVDALPDRIDAFMAIVHPEDAPRIDAAVDAHLTTRAPYDLEVRLRHADGSWRWGWLRGQAEWDADGLPLRMAGSLSDVTTRRAAEAALACSETRYALAISAIGLAVWDWDITTDAMTWSAHFTELFGYPVTALPSTMAATTGWWADRIHPDDRAVAVAQFGDFRSAMRRGDADTWQTDYRFQRADGEYRVVSDRVRVARDAAGAPTRMVGALADVTVERALAAQLQQARQLEAVGRLAASVAHDFNNLLAVVRGNVDLLGEALDDVACACDATRNAPQDVARDGAQDVARDGAQDVARDGAQAGARDGAQAGARDTAPAVRLAQAEARDALRDVDEAVSRASGLVRHLLSLARQQPSTATDVPLGSTIGAIERLLRQAAGRDVRLVVQLAHDDDPVVHVDVAQLEQTLLNLVLNARDAVRAHVQGERATLGEIVVSVGRVTGADPHAPDATVADGAWAYVRVRDTGHGMDAATCARVFEPFFTTKPVGLGTGLGLPSVRAFVERSGGRITVDSTPDVGTTFCILLPSVVRATPGTGASASIPATADARAVDGCEVSIEATGRHALTAPLRASPAMGDARTRHSPDVSDTPPHILVVEDEPTVRQFVVRQLAQAGFEVHEASDGVEALDVVARLAEAGCRLDAVVTDVNMPRLDGVSLVNALRERAPSVPVVFMSGFAGDAGLPAPNHAASAWLDKPFTGRDLLAALGALRVRGSVQDIGAAEAVHTKRGATWLQPWHPIAGRA